MHRSVLAILIGVLAYCLLVSRKPRTDLDLPAARRPDTMAIASATRSVARKILAVETPEVSWPG